MIMAADAGEEEKQKKMMKNKLPENGAMLFLFYYGFEMMLFPIPL